MTIDANKELVSRIAEEIWNQGNLTVIDEVMTPNATYHGPHMPDGVGDRDNWRRAIEMYLKAFPDSHVTFEDLIAVGDMVVGRWSAKATHTRDLPEVSATGKSIDIGGITIYRIVNGKIVEAWEQLDLLGMWRQLGVIAIPNHKKG